MSKKNLTVTVTRVERGPRSPMGNPSFIFHTDAGVFMTRKDAQCGYVVITISRWVRKSLGKSRWS